MFLRLEVGRICGASMRIMTLGALAIAIAARAYKIAQGSRYIHIRLLHTPPSGRLPFLCLALALLVLTYARFTSTDHSTYRTAFIASWKTDYDKRVLCPYTSPRVPSSSPFLVKGT